MIIECSLDNLFWNCIGQISAYTFFMNSIRYYPLAGILFFILWKWKKEYFQPWRIQQIFPKASRILYEIKYSFSTLIVFAILGVISIVLIKQDLTFFYTDIDKYSIIYLPISFFILTAWHETWFYWMHRIVHKKGLFEVVHLVHHKSTNPSPLAAYSFHPLEAILEGLYLMIFILIVPIHPIVLIAHTFIAMFLNMVGHLGYEFYPSGWTRSWIGKHINTSTHHNMHHSHVNCNYSLYLNFWDKVCKTNHPQYQDIFEDSCQRRKQGFHNLQQLEIANYSKNDKS